MKHVWRFGTLCLLLLLAALAAPRARVTAADAPDDAPRIPTDDPLAWLPFVSGYTMADNVVFYYINPTCPGGGGGPNRAPEDPVVIGRLRSSETFGVRELFSRNPTRPAGTCNPYQILSNLAVDDDNVYFIDAAGLQQLPRTAIPGDPLTLLTALPGASGQRNVIDGGANLYLLLNGVIYLYPKAGGTLTTIYNGDPPAGDLQFDGLFLYFIAGGALKALNSADNHALIPLFSNVAAYRAPGPQTTCGGDAWQWVYSAAGSASYAYLNYATQPLDQLHVHDFTGDGKADVFSTLPRAGGGHQWVISNAGTAGYANAAWDFADPADLRFGDFNGDGKTDVFYAAWTGSTYQWKYSPGGTANYVNLNFASTPPADLRFGNFTGDAKTDIFTVTPGAGGLYNWLVSTSGTASYTTINAAGAPLADIAFGDLNGDGKTDVFRAIDLGGGQYQWQYASAGSGAWQNLRQEPYSVQQVGFGDFVGDERDDVFVTSVRPDGNFQWHVSDGGTGALQNLAYAGQDLPDVRFADIDGNGKSDVFATLTRDFCRTLRPLYYAYKDDGVGAILAGIGGRVRWHDLNSGQNGTLYSSPRYLFDQSNEDFASMIPYNSVAATNSNIFFVEKYSHYCTLVPGCFVTPTRTQLKRMPLIPDVYKGYFSSGTPDLLYLNERSYNAPSDVLDMDLANDQEFLFWPDYSVLYRLATNAAALPVVNLRVTRVEVTQGIQNTANSVRLIRGKDTWVRVLVDSDGPDVRDVDMQLRVYHFNTHVATLNAPARRTVRATPDAFNLDHQFLFYLPLYLTDTPNLRVEARLNPTGYPLEPAGMGGDNIVSSSSLALFQSPQIEVIFVEFGFDLNGPPAERVTGTGLNAAWIGRVFPLGYIWGEDGYDFGLTWSTWEVEDAGVAPRVNWGGYNCTNDEDDPNPNICAAYYVCNAAGTILDTDTNPDNRNLCASDYVNGRLAALRSQRAIGAEPFLYGAIPDTRRAGQFPRGQAGQGRSSSGPDGAPWQGYYAGHEVGHTAALGHPANGGCDVVGADPIPNHPQAHIGPNDDSVNGLTLANLDGDSRWEMSLLRGSQWFDFMGYCNSARWPHQWVSDQNYERMYTNFSARRAPDAPWQAGDWLAVFGSLNPAGNGAALTLVERWDGAAPPPIVAGDYAVRLRNAANAIVATTPFAPEASSDGERQPFGLVVPFVAGARRLQIIRLSNGAVLAERLISAAAPTVGSVTVGASGSNAVINWTAADGDGDALHFDLYVSHDGGATFRPLALGVASAPASVPLSRVGGGTVIVQVLASDGVQTATADSAPTALPAQPPVIANFQPDCAQSVNLGQPVNFSADVRDPQDGTLPPAALQWTVNGVAAGSGQSIAVNAPLAPTLRPGANTIVLSATNSLGQTATQTCSLFVTDDLSIPPARLLVAPDAVEWLATAAAPTLQTATLALTNGGDGALTWSATLNGAWVQLDAAAGDVPGTLTLSADPTGLAAGSLHRAVLTLTGHDLAGTPVNSINVPISLWVDHPGYAPPLIGQVPTALGMRGVAAAGGLSTLALAVALLLGVATLIVRRR